MSAAHYVRFCKNAGLLELGAFAKADLEIMHTRLCAQQEWRANEPAQKRCAGRRCVRAPPSNRDALSLIKTWARPSGGSWTTSTATPWTAALRFCTNRIEV